MSPKTISPGIVATEPSEISPSVLSWRLEQLEAAGYPVEDALLLGARHDVDLHVAVRLLRRGCPVATALRILL